LKFVITELGCHWAPGLLHRLDDIVRNLKSQATGELRFAEGTVTPLLPSEYFGRNCWLGVSQPRVSDIEAARLLGPDRIMWGNDYPHDEGTFPFTRETLRQVFAGASASELRAVLAENAAALYGFDLGALAPYADQHGPTVAEVARPLTALPPNANQALRLATVTR